VTAANRKRAAARLDDRFVLDDKTLPPDILLPGARQSHDVKCFTLGHARRSVPHSPTSFSDRDGPIPWICIRSKPRTPTNAALTSNEGVLTCFVLVRRRGNSLGSYSVSAANAASGTQTTGYAEVSTYNTKPKPPRPTQTPDNASSQMPIRNHANSIPNRYQRLANSYLRVWRCANPFV